MKVVPDTMIWVSYSTLKGGFRHQLIERARRQRVRLFVSEYILQELTKTLIEDLGRTQRYAWLARRAVLRISRWVDLPATVRTYVSGDPNDDPVIQTALTTKAHYLVTADKLLLKLQAVHGVSIITANKFQALLS